VENESKEEVDKAKAVLTVEFVKNQVQLGSRVPEEVKVQVCEDIIKCVGAFS